MKDLFETPELIPETISKVLESIDEDKDIYAELARVLKEIEELGYTFDYYLDAVPYGLRPIGVEITDLEGWEN
jgi:division protein CdvB (Snf7/Vps24/ESCRT-III family)